MTCPSCRADNRPGARFCGRCGSALGRPCPSCGAGVDPGLPFCTSCGARLAGDDGPALGEERKVVSVVFADLVGFTSRAETLDPEDVRRLLARYYDRVRAELERFGGTVEKFIGDAVMALFGAPVTHEDDPERAVRASLAVRDAVAALNEAEPGLDLHVRVGVTTGEALVSVGDGADGYGLAAGDVVNSAARLQAAAPTDGILVDEATHRATAQALDYRAVDAIRAKGKAERIAAWEALAARSRASRDEADRGRAPLVGRAEELELLLDALERARRDSRPQLVTVVGPPGIGKSRLVLELFREVEQGRELVLWRQGRSLPYGEGVTFWAVAEMVKAHAGILHSDPAETAAAKLAVAVRRSLTDAGEAEWTESHLRPLVGLGGEDESPGDRRDESFAAWRRFFESLAEARPLVLVFEDLHWADDGLLDFVDHVVDWTSDVPLLVVATARPELLDRRSGWGGGKRNAVTASLSPLSEVETGRLVAALLEQPTPPPELAGALFTHAGGNPLYAEQYVLMLQDRGLLERGDRGWHVAARGPLPVPDSVQAILAARLDVLAREEKALLQDAAVVGRVVWVGVLAAIAGLPRWTVEERLRALERKELLRRERRSSVASESEWAFRHVLVRDVAYTQIPRAARAEKHRLAAEWIASLAVDRSEDRAEMLVHHYVSALEFARISGQPTRELAERARAALEEAGDRALALNAFAAAVRFYGATLELLPPDDDAWAGLLFRLGRARFHAEGRGADELTRARDALLAAGDRERAAEADVMLGELLWTEGRRDPAFECFRSATALLDGQPASRAKAFALSNLARFLVAADEVEAATRVAFEALEMAGELEIPELCAHALNSIGVARATFGDRGGVVDLERSIAIASEINSPQSLRGYMNLGSTLANLGDLSRAFAVHAEGRRAAERFGVAAAIRWFAAERLYEHYWSGRWNDALALADELIGETAGAPHYMEFDCRQVRGWIHLARADPGRAADDAARALAFARDAKTLLTLCPALALSASAALAVGQLDEADALATELLRAWRDEGVTLPSFWTADLARVLVALGRGSELVERGEGTAAPTRWLAAATRFAAGDPLAAAALYAKIASRPDEACARLEAARQLLASGRREDAAAELDRALAFFREVGASASVREAERLLGASP